ncbi:DNA polymerase III subunit beta [Spiroplasma turonicum]|uniref:Beta sliding clamp n=1 Tax=Spiroplasma turonicum TaxID=216946 RepID=A0A0K1P4N9_9MOLU|nr:DNA polymerase III subunit beta [Spiroplasma turonicum]AKU79248.1 DNA polymerase III subunit beta [Spiroplasma turonicum]ALX70271.1 DNA polymerase III subunit beta [Spiroplasma turonicum]
MFFSINRIALIEEINKCNRIIDIKTPSPSITGILIDVNIDSLSLTSTNTVVSIKSLVRLNEMNLNIKQVGSMLIKGKYFLDILKKMDDDIVNISCVENNVAVLSGKKLEFSLNILDFNEYPNLAFREKGDSINVNCFDLKKALNQTIISVNEWKQKIVLSGLNFALKDGAFYITGTDGYRVSRKRLNFWSTNIENKFETNIPYRSVLEIIKLLPDNGECKIVIVDSYTSIVINNTVFQTTILEGQFPDVNAVFPSDFNTTIFVDNKKFFKLISRADLPNDDNSIPVVNMILEDEKIIIKSSIHQVGSFEETFEEFELKGIDSQSISFNSKYLIDSLKTFETKTLEINLIDSKKPIVISSAEDDSLSQIILPMFTS